MSEEAGDRGFEVIDRRGGRGEPAGGGEPGQTEEHLLTEEELIEEIGQAPAPDFSSAGLLRFAIGLFEQKAWAGLGLQPEPVTGRVEKDLQEARRAIDVVGDLARHLEPLVDADERRHLQVLLSNLRINFVRQSGPGGGGA